jgi:hypothetical protein
MARFTSVDLTKSIGFDEDRDLLTLSARQSAELFLVSGENLRVFTDDPDLVSVTAPDEDVRSAHKTVAITPGEKGQSIRRIALKAGGSEGTTQLWAVTGNISWAGPLAIHVVHGAERRQVGDSEPTQEMRKELSKLSIRDAVTRVAEDQMNSKICLGDGFGTYMAKEIMPGTRADWCGGFAHWCWRRAAAIKNVENPFGEDSRVLWSPQRAIQWAMRNPAKAMILRYEGGDPGPNEDKKAKQEWHEIGEGSLERADIVLVRKIPANPKDGNWKHVTQIDWVGESTVHTIDGNQGNGRCIQRRIYDIGKKLANGQYELAFLHVLV